MTEKTTKKITLTHVTCVLIGLAISVVVVFSLGGKVAIDLGIMAHACTEKVYEVRTITDITDIEPGGFLSSSRCIMDTDKGKVALMGRMCDLVEGDKIRRETDFKLTGDCAPRGYISSLWQEVEE